MKSLSKTLSSVVLSSIFSICLANVAVAQTVEVTVKTPLGELRGLTNTASKVNEFKGIQYATAERFAMAVPVKAWSGIKDAKKFASNCPQAARFKLTEQSLNEDCLYLNVSVPADLKPNEKLPVMVWIPGDGVYVNLSDRFKDTWCDSSFPCGCGSVIRSI
jgi:para-nitrobenzyl esterase